jgi:cytidylate kinase
MRLEGIDEREARRRQRASDRAQIDYVKHFYGADPRDWRHYHILLNSAALSPEECVTSIVNAAGSSAAPPAWQTTIEGTRA